ncbi:MAG: Glutamine transport ATP-binding protein GlnQ [Planctomycetes bacterium]|nr:Glutamine transport ATP-binding protein GlnQ [Planctomycetota bacterium]
MSGPLVRIRGLRKRWGGVTALDGVDLDVAPGEVVAVIGPSGGGKSTLLRCVNGLEAPDAGTVEVEGRPVRAGAADIDRVRARIGMVFQAFHLFPHLTALGNVTLAPRLVRGESADAADRRGRALLDRVGLGDRAGARPDQLSGGQRQRVAIARALAMEPSLLLFDEPTSALDPETTGEVLDVMRDLARSGTTMIVVTHEMAFARECSSRTLFMDGGRIAEDGPSPALFAEPRSPRLRAFLARTHGGAPR